MSGCGEGLPATAPSPARPAEFVAQPPSYSGRLPDGSEVTLRFLAFQPARGAALQVGEGAYIRVEVTVPDQMLLVDVTAEGWDGTRVVGTSFWYGGGVGFVCPPGANTRKQFLLGRDHSSSTPYPVPSDPDVPFVRVKVQVVPFERACNPPVSFPGDPTPPVITAIERLDWKRP